ncbi:hypothetical protein [Planktothrix paucivesiculata]|uniref:Uncharacterized protein n=1 Tax=Planktothrix paucivesiculata PCC 9631 TaxID=671071 RepID=A0A7Z9E0I6_9CYAN|nr:hypothetical protein [Planktothrix paucivesiculata]VXD19605.1 hypothetical protein PL9631_450084 [Planktothrix paucivesiculata PCC 9631]
MSEELIKETLENNKTNKMFNLIVGICLSLLIVGLIFILIFTDTSIEIKQVLIVIIGLFSFDTLDAFRKILESRISPLSITINNNNSVLYSGDIYNTENRTHYQSIENQNLAEVAAEIQKLLKQLTLSSDFNEESEKPTESEKLMMSAKLVEKIEENPSLKQRLINVTKAGGIAALETAIGITPITGLVIAAMQGWNDNDITTKQDTTE